jgi:rod shape-determining protein MreD
MTTTSNWLVIITTFIVALILTLLPMPDWTAWLRPAWVLMVLIYWLTVMPYRVNLGTAWIAGLALDVLNGSLLGEHALALTLVGYLAVRIHSRFRMFPLLQQGLFVCVFVLLYQAIIFCIQGFIGQLPRSWLYWSSAFTSMLLWPWVFVIMHDCRRRFRVV